MNKEQDGKAVKIGSTITMHEQDLHRLIITAGEVAYDRCKQGQSFDKTRMELIDALVAVTRPMTDDEYKEYGLES